MADLSHWALGANQPDELLRESLQVAVDLMGSDYGTAVRLLPDGRLRVAKELGPEPFAPGTVVEPSTGKSYILRVIETGEPFVSADLRRDPRVDTPFPLTNRGVVSGLAVPVRGPHAVMGVLALHSRRRRRFNRDDVAAAGALASVVATAWEQAEHRERLVHQALHDPLTELPNRTLFVDRLNHALARRVPPRDEDGTTALAVMLIDLDDFKGVNDGYGHAAGDRLLQVAAQRFSSVVRPQDTVARLGGDEFGLLCDGLADGADAVSLAHRIQHACRAPVEVTGASLMLSASIGISSSHRHSAEADQDATVLLGEADAALYRAKDLGRGQVEVFDARLRHSTTRRRTEEADLEAALVRDEFRVHYQPLRRPHDLHAVGVEALVRWQHPSRGLLLPDQLIPVAERTGLIRPLGEWVLRTACAQVARWQHELASSEEPPLWLAVNVSPHQLNDPGLPRVVADARHEAALAEGTLVLELTESALLPGDHTHLEALTQLGHAGARLFLDDFGTGYSSLTHLTHLPIHGLKIDKSFVAGLPVDHRETAVVSSIVGLSADLGLTVVAEGVETPDQLRALALMSCHAVQGFLLDRPGPEPHLSARVLPPRQRLTPSAGYVRSPTSPSEPT